VTRYGISRHNANMGGEKLYFSFTRTRDDDVVLWVARELTYLTFNYH
jgi:hypothetical protein